MEQKTNSQNTNYDLDYVFSLDYESDDNFSGLGIPEKKVQNDDNNIGIGFLKNKYYGENVKYYWSSQKNCLLQHISNPDNYAAVVFCGTPLINTFKIPKVESVIKTNCDKKISQKPDLTRYDTPIKYDKTIINVEKNIPSTLKREKQKLSY